MYMLAIFIALENFLNSLPIFKLGYFGVCLVLFFFAMTNPLLDKWFANICSIPKVETFHLVDDFLCCGEASL